MRSYGEAIPRMPEAAESAVIGLPPEPANGQPMDRVNESHDLVELEQLYVEFGRHVVLRDISLRIPLGQTLVVIGESGCGKTVLLKTIIGLLHPSRGLVRVDGLELPELTDRQLTELRARFGFVFQNAALFDSLTIGQNVAFPLRQHRRLADGEIQQVVRDALSEVGLPEAVLHRYPAELSGGMRKRVGLARALVMNPELILYDEPTTGLDPIMSDVINELILRTQRRAQRHQCGHYARHEYRPQSRRPCRHDPPGYATGGGGVTDPLRRKPGPVGSGPRSTCATVRPR